MTASTTSSWRARRSALSPWATVSRGEWSVSTRYSWPSSTAVNAISSIGEPPSDQSEWECRSPRSAARSSRPPGRERARVLRLQRGQPLRHLARDRRRDHLAGARADAGQVGEAVLGHQAGDLVGRQRQDRRGGLAEGLDLEGVLAGTLEQEGDAAQRRHRPGAVRPRPPRLPATPPFCPAPGRGAEERTRRSLPTLAFPLRVSLGRAGASTCATLGAQHDAPGQRRTGRLPCRLVENLWITLGRRRAGPPAGWRTGQPPLGCGRGPAPAPMTCPNAVHRLWRISDAVGAVRVGRRTGQPGGSIVDDRPETTTTRRTARGAPACLHAERGVGSSRPAARRGYRRASPEPPSRRPRRN